MAKLKRYDGTTSVESSLSQFHACNRYYNWDDEDKSLELRCLLDGEATKPDDISYKTPARRPRGDLN